MSGAAGSMSEQMMRSEKEPVAKHIGFRNRLKVFGPKKGINPLQGFTRELE